ncbi:MAG: GHMP kinase [Candidatus Omnitrophica bacterium]|nr:GHMP kinase [Candidatus Omnitrophota bacterium]
MVELVVTRTPLRISFAGGGTDLPAFYEREHGAVLSTTIDKYLYVTVKRHGRLFNEAFRLNYSETEHVQQMEAIKNHIARECLRLVPVEPPLYINTVADIPEFSGLGSSSSFSVGLLNALHVFRGERASAVQLAEEASHIEMDVLKRPIGKQDHYAAAFGGLNFFCFQPDGRVTVEPQHLPEGAVQRLFDHLVMFWTAMSRDAASVLKEQQDNIPEKFPVLQTMREDARFLQGLLHNGFDPLAFGRLLDTTWQRKRQLASRISNDRIDAWYERAKEAGAVGGKICGAGGGGFLLLVSPQDRQDAIRLALHDMQEVRVGYEANGSCVLLARDHGG